MLTSSRYFSYAIKSRTYPLLLRALKSIITTSHIGRRFINPSRAAPSTVTLGGAGNNWLIQPGSHGYQGLTVFFSLVTVWENQLVEPIQPGGSTRKMRWLRGMLLRGETERLIAFFCMAFDLESINASFGTEGLSFGTMVEPLNSSGGETVL
jgi:hypothetical protein